MKIESISDAGSKIAILATILANLGIKDWVY